MQLADPDNSFGYCREARPAIGLKETARVESGLYAAFKMAADWVAALVFLILSLPVIILGALLIKLGSRGPMFYSQTRLGKNGRTFTIHKIRTMVHNCEAETGAQWATRHDPRIVPVGRFLRRMHIDELPQLLNVLRGEMSLIGPRPERPEIATKLEREIPYYHDRLRVRPGMTGLAQLQLPADVDVVGVRRKLVYDLYYVQHLSFWLDVQIMASTALYLIGIPFCSVPRPFRVPAAKRVESSPQSQFLLNPTVAAIRELKPASRLR